MSYNAISYNKASSKEFGWRPAWFGAAGFDWDLVTRVKAWQRDHGLGADGRVGAATFRAAYKVRERSGHSVEGAISAAVLFNRTSAQKLGWKPSWFGGTTNDEALIRTIKTFQRDWGLTGDGLVGDATFRRLLAVRTTTSPTTTTTSTRPREGRRIVFRGESFPIDWKKVVLWTEEGGLRLDRGFKNYARRPRRDIKMFVNHWDACTSSAQCARVLRKRGLGVHFCIDNDGTIFQLIDMQHPAWHAKGVNMQSVGVEISNVVYADKVGIYPKPYERTVIHDIRVHGGAYPGGRHGDQIVDYHPEQLAALKALWKAVHGAAGVPLQVPTDTTGALLTGVHPEVAAGTYRGFVCHYHLNRQKYDCAGLDLVRLRDEVQAML